MKVYTIAENCQVVGKYDNFDEKKEFEPVVCIPLGIFTNIIEAKNKVKKLNKEYNEIERIPEKYSVVSLSSH